jgi:hypothetical protein
VSHRVFIVTVLLWANSDHELFLQPFATIGLRSVISGTLLKLRVASGELELYQQKGCISLFRHL